MLLAERLRREEPAWGGEWRPGLLHAAAGAHCVQQVMIVMVMMIVMMILMTIVYNRFGGESVEVEVSWYNSALCPKQQHNIEASGFRTLSHYTRPATIQVMIVTMIVMMIVMMIMTIQCGEASVTARVGNSSCSSSNIAQTVHSLYVSNNKQQAKCAITMS